MSLTYTRDQLLADPPFAQRLRHDGRLLHGGLDAAGQYLPPRSAHRLAAIRGWREQLAAAGHLTDVLGPEVIPDDFFPSEEQAKVLLRNGARGAMARILTLIGLVEGFGNDGIKLMPPIDFRDHLVEPIDGTCLAHLHAGLLEAHGNDESGRGEECGHDQMWFAIRDAALDRPEILPEYFTNLPIAPPPGYEGPAQAAPEAISVGSMMEPLLDGVDPFFELTIRGMATILVIELMAFRTFEWAARVLSDSACSVDPDFAISTIDHIRVDEEIHVDYLQTALAELSTLTVRKTDGSTLPGAELVAAACRSAVDNQTGDRFDRILAYRYAQIRTELLEREDGEQLIAEFDALGPVPA
ncbi:MAG: hypothetical protein Q8K58_03700 [Acidimicrobiales bacterium]|nr:hypothetical protein [Acidimicrobiales bacterium]